MFNILEKYAPKTFDDIEKKYPNVSKIIRNLNKNNISNLLIYGNESSGKKTVLYTFLPAQKLKKIETFKGNNKNIEFTIYYNKTFIELDVKEMGIYKKYILRDVIKKYTQSKNIVDSGNKIIIIHNLQLLDIEDQYILRKIIEEYICNCRFILISKNINNLIDPIKSRCLCLRLDGFKENEVFNFLKNINDIEKYNFTDDNIMKIIRRNKCNLKKSILELSFNYEQQNNYELNTKDELINEYIIKLLNIVKNKNNLRKNINEIESIIYDLFINYEIHFADLIKLIYNEIISQNEIDELSKIKLCKLMMESSKNQTRGSKEIFHSQNFVYNLINIV
jgi:replication factor C subunit 3/5